MKAFLTLACGALSACTTVLVTPPVRSIVADTAVTLPHQATVLGIEGGGGGEVLAGVGPGVFGHGTVRVRRGLDTSGTLEGALEANTLVYETGDHALSLFVGVKRPIVPKHLALTAGVGAGFSGVHRWRLVAGDAQATKTADFDMTGHVGTDLGLVSSFANDYLFASIRGLLAAPIGADAVELPESDSLDELKALQMHLTFGAVATFGLRVPLLRSGDHTSAISFAFAMGGLRDLHDNRAGFMAGHVGVEAAL